MKDLAKDSVELYLLIVKIEDAATLVKLLNRIRQINRIFVKKQQTKA